MIWIIIIIFTGGLEWIFITFFQNDLDFFECEDLWQFTVIQDKCIKWQKPRQFKLPLNGHYFYGSHKWSAQSEFFSRNWLYCIRCRNYSKMNCSQWNSLDHAKPIHNSIRRMSATTLQANEEHKINFNKTIMMRIRITTEEYRLVSKCVQSAKPSKIKFHMNNDCELNRAKERQKIQNKQQKTTKNWIIYNLKHVIKLFYLYVWLMRFQQQQQFLD